MARTVRDTKLESRSAREKLKARGKPYYRAIDAFLHLGYRKGKAGGKWVVRRYTGAGEYVVETLEGVADDLSDADRVTVLSYHDAQRTARALASQRGREAAGESASGPFTVRRAVEEHLASLAARGKAVHDATNRAALHIYPELGELEAAKLIAPVLRKWHEALGKAPRRVRTKKDAPPRFLPPPSTAEERRSRKSSANRTLTVLKAALNRAFEDGKVSSDVAWRSVPPFQGVESARIRYLTIDEITRLVNGCAVDFRNLVNAALLTGCRLGELTALRVDDFNPDAGTLRISESKSGKPRHVVLTAEGQQLFASLVAGRPADAVMLTRANGSAWGKSRQRRPMLEACQRAGIKPAVGFHVLRHSYASHLVMAGVPLQVAAQNLGHADTRMTEKHYAHLAPSYVAETIRKLAPEFGTVKKGIVRPLRAGR
jgi:integrase